MVRATFYVPILALAIFCQCARRSASDDIPSPAQQSATVDTIRVFLSESVNLKPVVRYCPVPRYPQHLLEARVAGRVMLEFIVARDGIVELASVRVISATHQDFVNAATQAVRQCRFEPGRVGRYAVRVRVQMPIVFGITDHPSAPGTRRDGSRLSSKCAA